MHIEDTGRLVRQKFEMLLVVSNDEEKMDIQKLFSIFFFPDLLGGSWYL